MATSPQFKLFKPISNLGLPTIYSPLIWNFIFIIYFARYILFLDGRFSFLSFLLKCRLHIFLFYQVVVYIDLYIKKGTSLVRGATVLVLSLEDKTPKLASTVSSWWCCILLVSDLSFFFMDCRYLDCVFRFILRIVSLILDPRSQRAGSYKIGAVIVNV